MRDLPHRPYSHQIAAEGTSFLRENLPKEWSALELPVQNDYGVDFFVEVFESQIPTGTVFFIQCKSISGRRSNQSEIIALSWPVRNLVYLLDKELKSLLVVYVAAERTAYWLWLNQWLVDKLDIARPNWRNQRSVSLTFPVENVFSPSIIRRSVFREHYPHELNIDETVFSLCAHYKDIITVLIDIADNGKQREIADYTSSMEELNKLLGSGVVAIAVTEVSGYWGSESWALRPVLTPKGQRVVDFINKHRELVRRTGERGRYLWTAAG